MSPVSVALLSCTSATASLLRPGAGCPPTVSIYPRYSAAKLPVLHPISGPELLGALLPTPLGFGHRVTPHTLSSPSRGSPSVTRPVSRCQCRPAADEKRYRKSMRVAVSVMMGSCKNPTWRKSWLNPAKGRQHRELWSCSHSSPESPPQPHSLPKHTGSIPKTGGQGSDSRPPSLQKAISFAKCLTPSGYL